MKRVRATTVAVEYQYYTCCVWICSSRYPACNVHGPYCHPWPTPL